MSGEPESPGETAPTQGMEPRVAAWRWRRAVYGGSALLLTAGAAFWLRNESEPRQRDYHAVRREFERIERKIHDHDMGLWLVVEGEPHDQGAGAAAREERHRRILDDFEKLGHGQDFAMSDVQIEIDGDRAHLRYTLHSSPQPWRPMPGGGRMEFVRRQGRWVLDDHHFVDDPVTQWRSAPPRPSHREHMAIDASEADPESVEV